MIFRKHSAGLLCVAAFAACAAEPADEAAALLKGAGMRGGLVVHVGCGDGRLTAALHGDGRNVVQGLTRDAASVETARQHIRALGLYGAVSVTLWDEPFLPYVDGLVNLLVVETPQLVAQAEQLRVLAPGGVVYVRQGERWIKAEKPARDETDEWTHTTHDASGNPVSADTVVGPPKYLRWSAPPTNLRSHEYTSGIYALVSAGGRTFHVEDKAKTSALAALPQWHVVARDAYNGLLLWERPLASWFSHLAAPWGGGASSLLQRRMVAVSNRVFVPLAYFAPVSMLDAATGELLATFAETKGATEIVVQDGILLVMTRAVTDEQLAAKKEMDDMARRRGSPLERRDTSTPLVKGLLDAGRRATCTLVAIDVKTRQVLWQKTGPGLEGFREGSLRVVGDRVLYGAGGKNVCLELATGKQQWAVPGAYPKVASSAGSVCWSTSEVSLFAIEDGTRKWRQKPVLESIRDAYVIGDSVWVGGFKPYADERHKGGAWGPYFLVERDIESGNVVREIAQDNPGHHQRCYTNTATPRFILGGRRGTEFVDLGSGEVFWHSWARGTCRYGVMPANGILYTPSHACACYQTARLTGFNATVTNRSRHPGTTPRLTKGPAYGEVSATEKPGDWPVLRASASRSGYTATPVPVKLKLKWQKALASELTAPTVAGDRVYVACPDVHRVQAVDRASGRPAWEFTAGGRVDSPPTVHGGQVSFGSRDGHVYSLRAEDGELVWRFRGAREPLSITSYGQLESISPVHGSVLVQNGTLCFTTGRSPYLDDGIDLCRLDARTGKLLSEAPTLERPPNTASTSNPEQANDLPGARTDLLTGDETYLYLRDMTFTHDGRPVDEKRPHLFTLTSFLDGSWPHRSYWVFGTTPIIRRGSGGGGSLKDITYGRILVFNESHIYGYARLLTHWSNPFRDEPHQLFKRSPDQGTSKGRQMCVWSADTPMQVRAMVLAGDVIFAAGPVAGDPREGNAAQGTLLAAFATDDGRELSRLPLPAAPVFDGMAAAGGELVLTLEGGKVVCLSGTGD